MLAGIDRFYKQSACVPYVSISTFCPALGSRRVSGYESFLFRARPFFELTLALENFPFCPTSFGIDKLHWSSASCVLGALSFVMNSHALFEVGSDSYVKGFVGAQEYVDVVSHPDRPFDPSTGLGTGKLRTPFATLLAPLARSLSLARLPSMRTYKRFLANALPEGDFR